MNYTVTVITSACEHDLNILDLITDWIVQKYTSWIYVPFTELPDINAHDHPGDRLLPVTVQGLHSIYQGSFADKASAICGFVQ